LDAHWPHRDRRTDGWITIGRVSYGHNPDGKGAVHAIDVDKDGIDQMWIINNIYKGGGVLWYIIWNRGIWTRENGWRRQYYDGSNPHTDHLHIEVLRDNKAENYGGNWGIASGHAGFGAAPGVDMPVEPAAANAPAWAPWRYDGYVDSTGRSMKEHAGGLLGYRDAFRKLRR
jgi:hypothetical protein